MADAGLEQSVQSFAARDFPGCSAYFFPRCDQEVADPLMIALCPKMPEETDSGCRQRALSAGIPGRRLRGES